MTGVVIPDRDLILNFAEGYCRIHMGDKLVPGYIDSADDGTRELWVVINGEETVRVPVDEVDLEWPELGMRNTNNGALYLSRRVAVQYRRAIKANNIEGHRFSMHEANISGSGAMFRSQRALEDLYEPTYPGKSYSLWCLRGSKDVESMAISQSLALVGSKGKGVELFWKLWNVGTILDNGDLELNQGLPERIVRQVLAEWEAL